MPICKKCGTKNDKDNIFCEECGARLVSEEPVIEKTQPKRKKSKLGLIIGIPLGCIIVAGVILLLIVKPFAWQTTGQAEISTNLSTKAPLPAKIDLNGGTSTLDILGWSDNSLYFAFGERGEGKDPLDVPHQGFGEFWLVDVVSLFNKR